MNSIWKLPDNPVPSCIEDWAARLGIDAFLAGLLWRRGLDSYEAMDAFLMPRLAGLAPLDDWPGLPEACRELLAGIAAQDPILIWGDYDVDGVTGAALMQEVLAFHGIGTRVHLPDRQTEGYGLNIEGVERYAAEGVKVLLTVDCGISDVEAVRRARDLGLKVIITDHHLPPEPLPPADAICNPRLGNSPCPHLAGVGVAFFLMAAVNRALSGKTGKRMDMRQCLDIVCLGTLADVVPITGQNRILVKNGLLLLARADRPGIAELKALSGYSPSASLGAGQVVFGLAPRINAAGRLGSPDRAFSLLRCPAHDTAASLARELDQLNASRRSEEERILKDALSQAQAQVDAGPRAGLVIWSDDWHQGVIGIVASRLVETFYRPVLILCRDQEHFKGSGRSIPEFDLHAALKRCENLLLGYGGHHQAAGLRLAEDKLGPLRDLFDTVAREALGDAPRSPTLRLDGELDFRLASDFAFLKSLEQLQPFGMGNPEPVFASPVLTVRSQRLFGPKREHVSLDVTDTASGISMQAKLWRQAGQFPKVPPGTRLRLAYAPSLNAYNGVTSVELKVKDWDLVGQP